MDLQRDTAVLQPGCAGDKIGEGQRLVCRCRIGGLHRVHNAAALVQRGVFTGQFKAFLRIALQTEFTYMGLQHQFAGKAASGKLLQQLRHRLHACAIERNFIPGIAGILVQRPVHTFPRLLDAMLCSVAVGGAICCTVSQVPIIAFTVIAHAVIPAQAGIQFFH